MVKKKDESWAAYRCSRKKCNSVNVDPIEKYCYACGGRRLKKNK